MRLLIATRNRGKLREYRRLLEGLPLELVTLDDVDVDLDVEETGETFEANARLKAEAYARASGLPTLADDSGLEVDALGGAPGVRSARYGAPEARSDEDRYRLLLRRLEGVPEEARTARFVCVVAFADPRAGVLRTARGTCEGRIARAPRGRHGFGYDPVFLLPDGRTMAELSPEEKNRISHRARALEALRPWLEGWVRKGRGGGSGTEPGPMG